MKNLPKRFSSVSALFFTALLGVALVPSLATAATQQSSASSMAGGMNNGMMKMMMNKTWVKQVQEALIHHGAKIPTDGICGKKTIDALRVFQKAHGLKVTGMPDPETLKTLGVAHPAG